MNLNILFKKIDNFEKLAAFDFDNICKNYAEAIKSEVAACINVINKLVISNKKAAKSEGISNIDDALGKINAAASQIAPDFAGKIINDIKSILGNITFYTLPSNAGTGFDPVTRIGGAWSAGAYIDRISDHVKNLEKLYKKFQSEQKSLINSDKIT